jgi:methionyl-tRNA synthetase
MFNKKKKFYITTSIAYTNAPPHIGFALESLQADVLARYHRQLGENTWYLTGTDEHGAKIKKAADKDNKDAKDFVDEISKKFRDLKHVLNLSNDDFIRTTDEKIHWPVVKNVWQKLQENGDLYKKQYNGLYCVGCEAFITKKDLVDGKCIIHQKEPEVIQEENYFFRLSKYADKIQKAIESDKIKIVPETKKNEVLSFIKQGLEDISFSRPRKDLKWGIPVPNDDSQTIYVWADALSNYISALNYPDGEKFKKYWPADVHCIGKDILKFHGIYWPAMLLSVGLDLPKLIFVHGFINVAGQKMSKSLGNVIDPFELVKKYGTDATRYYLLREIPSSEDGDFTYEKFEQRYNSDLASGIGNLVARVLGIAKGKVKIKSTQKTEQKVKEIKKSYQDAIENFKFNDALAAVFELISYCDKYINEEKLWETKNVAVISDLFYAIQEIADFLLPFLPETADKIKNAIKTGKSEQLFLRLKA